MIAQDSVMVVKRVHRVGEMLAVLGEPTSEMNAARESLSEHGRLPSRRTFERRLRALPDALPERIGSLGRHLVGLIEPWECSGRAVAVDSTVLRARGLGDTHYNTPEALGACSESGRFLVASGRREPYPHTEAGVEVRRIFHRLRHHSTSRTSTSISRPSSRSTGRYPRKGVWTPRASLWGRSSPTSLPCSIVTSVIWAPIADSKPSSVLLDELWPALS